MQLRMLLNRILGEYTGTEGPDLASLVLVEDCHAPTLQVQMDQLESWSNLGFLKMIY